MDYLSNLPHEVLIEIFRHCAVTPLTLVCKRFNDVIGSSPQLMKKLILVISDKANIAEIVTSERRHQGVRFKFNYKINDDSLNLFSAFHELKSLDFWRCILPAELFVAMLNRLPNLETFSFTTTYLKGSERFRAQKAPRMPKLKSMKLTLIDGTVFAFLKGARLESLSLTFSSLFNTNILIGFLKSQKSIEDLTLLSVPSIEGVLLSAILREMKNLKTFGLNLNQLDMESIKDLELTNSTVTTLTMFGSTDRTDDFRIFLDIFKCVKNLEVDKDYALSLIQPFAPSLEWLMFKSCDVAGLSSLQLPNLKCLTVANSFLPPIPKSNHWQMLASRSPLVNKIIIQDELINNSILATICKEFKHLQHLETLYDPEKLSSRIFDMICDPNFPRNIRFLKITQRQRSDVEFLKLNDEQKIALHAKPWLKIIFN